MVEALFVSAVFPVLVLMLSVVIRYAAQKRFPASAGADWLILLVTFDIGAAYTKDQLLPLVKYSLFHEWFAYILGLLAIGAGIMWVITALLVEPLLTRRPHIYVGTLKWKRVVNVVNRCRLCAFGLCWTVALSATCLHIFPFVYHP